jgi:predicted helicase
VPFDGIVLTDTFQMFEADDKDELRGFEVFKENNHRVQAQKSQPIRVIVGNPPYSVGQMNANENNQNLKYPTLDKRIFDTYVAETNSQSVSKLYDSYVRAIRWATDRIGEQGVVSFVVNGGFLDGSTTAGLRKTLIKEFSDVYVYDLRGNSRESHEDGKREGGNVFDIRIGVAMLILVRKPGHTGSGTLWYHKSDDYLGKQAKLEALHDEKSLKNVMWEEVQPNQDGDWLNQRSEEFSKYTPLGSKDKTNPSEVRIFSNYSLGLQTGRDSWMTDFSSTKLQVNVKNMIDG